MAKQCTNNAAIWSQWLLLSLEQIILNISFRLVKVELKNDEVRTESMSRTIFLSGIAMRCCEIEDVCIRCTQLAIILIKIVIIWQVYSTLLVLNKYDSYWLRDHAYLGMIKLFYFSRPRQRLDAFLLALDRINQLFWHIITTRLV